MHSALIGLLLLLAQTPEVPEVGQRVVAELRNGYRIEGIVIEKDKRSAVLSLESGEMRLDLKRVRSFHLPGTPRETSDASPAARQLSVPVRSPEGDRRLTFSVPEPWKSVEDESAKLTCVASKERIRFQVLESPETQSLWRITARLRRSFKSTCVGFEVKQERFGNRWRETRTWEIDFEYDADGERYRERRLYLDFGATKSVFVFRAPASGFSALVGHFESITSGLALESLEDAHPEAGRPDADDSKKDGNSEPGAPRTGESGDPELRLEDIEKALEEEIRQALKG